MPAAINWTPELENSIADRLITRSLRKICEEDNDLPHRITIQRRIIENPEFATVCARARAQNALYRLETAQDALDGADPESITQPGVKLIELKLNDARWLAERLLSKEGYGTRVQQEHSGEIGIKTVIVQPDVKAERERPAMKPEFGE